LKHAFGFVWGWMMADGSWLDWFLGRRITARLTWISASFLLPLSVLLWIYWNSVSRQIDFTRKEIKGVIVQRAQFELLAALARHQILSAMKAEANELASATDNVERNLERMERVASPVAVELGLNEEGFRFRKRAWASPEELRKAWRSGEPSARERCIGIVAEQISHVLDTSNLILDPDMDSFYLMDAGTVALPALTQGLGVLGSLLGKADSSQTMALGIANNRLREDGLTKFCRGIENAVIEDGNFHGLLLKTCGGTSAPLPVRSMGFWPPRPSLENGSLLLSQSVQPRSWRHASTPMPNAWKA
jgi:methyl-accepting chemotaxis protein